MIVGAGDEERAGVDAPALRALARAGVGVVGACGGRAGVSIGGVGVRDAPGGGRAFLRLGARLRGDGHCCARGAYAHQRWCQASEGTHAKQEGKGQGKGAGKV